MNHRTSAHWFCRVASITLQSIGRKSSVNSADVVGVSKILRCAKRFKLKARPIGTKEGLNEPADRELFYAVRVALDTSRIQIEDKPADLALGMAVTVEIKSRKRRIIDYLLSPLVRCKPGCSTGRERLGRAKRGNDFVCLGRKVVKFERVSPIVARRKRIRGRGKFR